MKIKFIKISNILSFKYCENINEAPEIHFDSGLNILIGQNGAGKSTALEVINFIFKKVMFLPYRIDQDLYKRSSNVPLEERKNIIQQHDIENHYRAFRLEPNWNSEDHEQKILIRVELDDIDKHNLTILEQHSDSLENVAKKYARMSGFDFAYTDGAYDITIMLNKANNKTFSLEVSKEDGGFSYFRYYNYYKELINFHNLDSKEIIPILQETFTLIGGYRNYNAFAPSVSLQTDYNAQIQQIRLNEYTKSANATDQAEPSIFNLVRVQIAALHQKEIWGPYDNETATIMANNVPFLKSINGKLALINLKVEVALIEKNNWTYNFVFKDLTNGRVLHDINSLSAGQKSIIHLIFESYGRGESKGGVIVIDEPELHLHYQFQYEYLRIIEQLNDEQDSQYILVTHSEALISSKTIDKVKRFALDQRRNTIVKVPKINSDQKTLIKILDNTRSTYAFFAKKVVLVEGDTDRYFFNSIFQQLKPELKQEIAVLDIGGKGNYRNWKEFFEAFGLQVFYIGDFDNVFSLKIDNQQPLISVADKATSENILKQNKFTSLSADERSQLQRHYEKIAKRPDFLENLQMQDWRSLKDCIGKLMSITRDKLFEDIKSKNQDLEERIDQLYPKNIFILKKGVLEDYTGTEKKTLDQIIPFCSNLEVWLQRSDDSVSEIKNIVNHISNA